jgi:hypothetical protein
MTTAPLLPDNSSGVALIVEDLRRIISPAEYRELIVSHRHLVRADEPALGLRGLKDLDTGEHFLIEERKLHEPRRSK